MRHSGATLLLSEGLPLRMVSEMLGHTDPMTTLRVYSHTVSGSQRQILDVWDRILNDVKKEEEIGYWG
jgi:integrase